MTHYTRLIELAAEYREAEATVHLRELEVEKWRKAYEGQQTALHDAIELRNRARNELLLHSAQEVDGYNPADHATD